MKESRLFQIVYCLLNQGHVTANQLATDLEVSIRTIYRDLDSLSAAGIPIYTESGRNGGIYLMKDYTLDKTLLSDTEKAEILTSLQGMNAALGFHNETVLNKLSALFHVDSTNWLEVDFSRWGNQGSDNRLFKMLKTAVLHHQAVLITYVSSYGEQRERSIYPLCLYYKAKAWYVKAYCPKEAHYRLFKLTRIIACKPTTEHFSNYSFPEHEDHTAEFPEITLRFSHKVAFRVYDEFSHEEIQRQTNGDLLVSAQMPADAWLIGFLLSFADQVEVISPSYLKHHLVEQAKLIVEKNKT